MPVPCSAAMRSLDAQALARMASDELGALTQAAAARRDSAWGRTLTFSPKVFLPLTNLCTNRCDYCSFRRSPGDDGAWTMSPKQVTEWAHRGRSQGCVEALFCLGDKPERGFSAYRHELAAWDHDGTVAYLRWAGERALALGLLPHTNGGVLDSADMATLRPVNVSLGLMLENVADRLCERGGPHYRAPDKRPAKRLKMHEDAGALRIPFTSGLLIGIGETLEERIETLLAIRESHERHGHIQEVIVQNFRYEPTSMTGKMADVAEPDDVTIAQAVALARLILPDEVSVQAPPNLNPAGLKTLVDAGINDLGGISPVTPDYINPGRPWPHLTRLSDACHALGFDLQPRLPVYDRFLAEGGWVDDVLREPIEAARARLNATAWKAAEAGA